MATEQTRLKKSKLAYIARRSGRDKKELQLMLEMADLQGKRVTVKYEVVNDR